MVIKSYVNGSWKKLRALADDDGIFKKYKIKAIRHEGLIACLLDCGRKYFTVNWIKGLIDLLSEYGYNALFLHFNEDMGMRIESVQYPWLAGSDSDLCTTQGITDDDEDKYLTQSEVLQIISYATAKNIEIIPSFDLPSHCNYIVKKYNEHYNTDIGLYYHYNNQTHIVEGSGNANYSRAIDITNENAADFIGSLLGEYAMLFYNAGCRKFDIGGDEILGWGTAVTSSVPKWQQLEHWTQMVQGLTGDNNATAYDAFLSFLNAISSILYDIGYSTVYCWNDQILRTFDTQWTGVVNLDKRISILYWTNNANNGTNTVLTYMQAGYNVINCLNTYNYYVLKDNYDEPEDTDLVDWTKEKYSNYIANQYEGKNKGSCFCIWCDNPSFMSESEVFEAVEPLLIVRRIHTVYPVALYYNFANSTPGNGAGDIYLDANRSDATGNYTLWWADASGIMSNYSSISTAALSLTAGTRLTYQKLNDYNAIPKYATRIVCTLSSDTSNKICGSYDIPENKLWNAGNYGEHLYSVGLMSDVHYQSDRTDWGPAFTYLDERESVDAICIAGDMTKNGTKSELDEWMSARDEYAITTPVYCSNGNHESKDSSSYMVTNPTSMRAYLDTDTTTDTSNYFVKTINNDVYIFVPIYEGSVAGQSGIMFSSDVLTSLENTLEQYRNQRVFLFAHVPPYYTYVPSGFGTGNNAYSADIWGHGSNIKSDRTSFLTLLEHYKNVIWFNGHTHIRYYYQETWKNLNIARYNTDGAMLVHISSLSVPREIENGSTGGYAYAESEGGIVDVYEDCIIIRNRDFAAGKFVGIAQYLIDTTPVTIPAKARVLDSINAIKTKTEYYTDEASSFNTDDVTVTAHYTNGTTDDVTASSTISGVLQSQILTPGTYTIYVSYTENGVTKADTITIVSSERPEPEQKTLVSISAQKDKMDYGIGETFSNSDVSVTALYSDDTTADVTSSASIGTINTSTSGSKTLSISYTENGATETTSLSIEVYTYEVLLDGTFDGIIDHLNYVLHSTITAEVGAASDSAYYVGRYLESDKYNMPLYYRLLSDTGISQTNKVGFIAGTHTSLRREVTNRVEDYSCTSRLWAPMIDSADGETPLMLSSTYNRINVWCKTDLETPSSIIPVTVNARIQIAVRHSGSHVLTGITAVKTKTEYTTAEVLSTNDVSVTATYSDGTTANVTNSATMGTIDLSSAGQKTLNISYSEGGVTADASITITVVEASVDTYTVVLDGTFIGELSSYGSKPTITPIVGKTPSSGSTLYLHGDSSLYGKQLYYRLLQNDGTYSDIGILGGTGTGSGSISTHFEDFSLTSTDWAPLVSEVDGSNLATSSSSSYIVLKWGALSSAANNHTYPLSVNVRVQIGTKD